MVCRKHGLLRLNLFFKFENEADIEGQKWQYNIPFLA